MPLWGIAAGFVFVFFTFALIHFITKKKRPFTRALLSMGVGPLMMTVINLASGVTHVAIPVSLLSVFTTVAGGVPGVTLLLFLNLLWGGIAA